MPWIVVKFLSTNEVEAIPLSWFNKHDNTVSYPNHFSKNALEKAIKSEYDPEPDVWASYEVELLRPHPYEAFITACAKASKACLTSDISEPELPAKRRPKIKNYGSSDESSDEGLRNIPPLPIKGLFTVYSQK